MHFRPTSTENKRWVHFLNVFLNLAGPEGLDKKNFKIETQGIKAQDKNNIISNRIDVSVLVIDCYQGFCHFISSQQYSQMSC
jgi:hypothetical protein